MRPSKDRLSRRTSHPNPIQASHGEHHDPHQTRSTATPSASRSGASKPVRNFCIDNFLEAVFAERVLAGLSPRIEEATRVGRSFHAVNEKGKVQVTDSPKLRRADRRAEPGPGRARVPRAALATSSTCPTSCPTTSSIGGGIHQTGPRGHLDVHVDFNYIADRELHRRLNILVYFNKDWKPEWGGNIELWDADVKVCHHSFSPIFNRCVVFETNEISFHGVTAVKCPEDRARKSFAAYYYTKEAPAHWTGEAHSTIFKARPDEVLKGNVMMPLENAKRRLQAGIPRPQEEDQELRSRRPTPHRRGGGSSPASIRPSAEGVGKESGRASVPPWPGEVDGRVEWPAAGEERASRGRRRPPGEVSPQAFTAPAVTLWIRSSLSYWLIWIASWAGSPGA